MKIYYYVHTGHRIGLDRFRRATTILRALNDVDITLLTSDFRISQIGRDFGIDQCIGIDVVRNISHIAHHGDILIFDSEEANSIMLDDMRNFFSTLIRISDKVNDKKEAHEFLISPYLQGEGICHAYAIDEKYFAHCEKTTKLALFFGDDDYEKDLEKHFALFDLIEPSLQLGFYYFLDYEALLKTKFNNYFEFEAYEQMITSSEILITSSPQAILESLASGGKPIYLKRDDYENNFITLFKEINIPMVENYDRNQLVTLLNNIDNHPYKSIDNHIKKIASFIKKYL